MSYARKTPLPFQSLDTKVRILVEEAQEGESMASGWNNMSIAYRRLGQCDEAKQAAEAALAISKDYRAALNNKRIAEFCLETLELAQPTKPEAQQLRAASTAAGGH